MGCPYNYKKRKQNRKKNTFPAELADMKLPEKAKLKELNKGDLNIPYYFRDTEWEF